MTKAQWPEAYGQTEVHVYLDICGRRKLKRNFWGANIKIYT